MSAEQQFRRIWRRSALLIPVVVVLLILSLFRLGNPQWCRWLYVFQTYVWPKYPDRLILAPDDYTGTWYYWYPNGHRECELHYENGKLHGTFTRWLPSGQKEIVEHWNNDRRHGPQTYYFPKWTKGI